MVCDLNYFVKCISEEAHKYERTYGYTVSKISDYKFLVKGPDKEFYIEGHSLDNPVKVKALFDTFNHGGDTYVEDIYKVYLDGKKKRIKRFYDAPVRLHNGNSNNFKSKVRLYDNEKEYVNNFIKQDKRFCDTHFSIENFISVEKMPKELVNTLCHKYNPNSKILKLKGYKTEFVVNQITKSYLKLTSIVFETDKKIEFPVFIKR